MKIMLMSYDVMTDLRFWNPHSCTSAQITPEFHNNFIGSPHDMLLSCFGVRTCCKLQHFHFLPCHFNVFDPILICFKIENC